MNEPIRFLARCLDPVHIGAGGYQLGRVDMSIVREPSTGIPKVPGTSLAGAVRAYAEMAKAEDDSLPAIRVVFGDGGTEGRQGMLRFYDADVVLFPVISDQGTVWVSTADRLNNWVYPNSEIKPDANDDKVIIVKGLPGGKPVNLGWLLLDTDTTTSPTLPEKTGLDFLARLVLVSDKLFHHLVNDNLEVRTSVEIDDDTGAAKAGALFTYEAIPRGTVLGFEVAIDDRRGNGMELDDVNRLLHKAFHGLKLLGIGGMGTRGFGRIELLGRNGKRDNEES
jgi:CRISPR-associated protein Cmr4